MKESELSQLLGCLEVFKNMYDHIRFVDPVNLVEININDKNELDNKVEKVNCFTFWGSNNTCKNCISMRAYIEKKPFVKIDYTSDKVIMTTAVPLEIKKDRVVIELIKDVSDSLVLENKLNGDMNEIISLIDKMNNLAVKDALTGVYNRRYINEKLPIDLMATAITDQWLSAIMIDIDHYKRVNDNFGHLAGDTVLKTLARTLEGCIRRETDWIARFGGEEFFICLPGSPIHKTVEIAEKMRRDIENKMIVYGKNVIRVTASFGVSCKKYSKECKFEEVIEDADKMLYKAKRAGRNRVEW